jgi:uncharacterized protein
VTETGLTDRAIALIHGVLREHPEVRTAILFGSRAKGSDTERSDVDLVVTGNVPPLRAEAIAAELDELPLPFRFEVQPLAEITHRELLSHIERVGVTVYSAT